MSDKKNEKDKEKITLTYHGIDRVRTRLGLPKKSAERIASLAYSKGFTIEDFPKGDFRNWLEHRRENTSNSVVPDLKIYGDKLFIFKQHVLITVVQIPYKYIKDIQKRKKKIEEILNEK